MTAMLPHRSPDPADENLFGPVARLSNLATELAEMPLGPRPAFRAELRARLLDEADRASGNRAAASLEPSGQATGGIAGPSSGRRRYGRRAAAVALALAVSGGGVAAASGRSLPGEPLYPVKRFGQSLRLALDPGTGVGPSLRLISDRISEVERTVAIDPTGTDADRWRAVDSALGDADGRLVRLSAAASPQELSTALAPERVRLDHLLPTVPTAHQDPVRALRDTIDGLAAGMPLAGAGALPFDIRPAGRLSPSDALAAGWPLDPALLRPPAALPTRTSRPPAGAAGGTSGTATSRPGTGGTGATGSTSASSPTRAGSTGLPQLPLGNPPSGGSHESTSGGVLPRTTSGIGSTVDRTVEGTLGGGTGSSTSQESGGTTSGGVGTVVGGIIGDATDTVGRVPLTKSLTGSTSSR